MNNQKLKEEHELAVCKKFISLYNSCKKSNLILLREGNPNRSVPDCICSDNIAIELVGVYDNNYQAQKIWNSVRGKKIKLKPQFQLQSLQNLENAIAKKLQKLNEGNYNGHSGSILLVCDLLSPLIQDKDIEKVTSEYKPFIADNSIKRFFYEIWIIWRSDIDGNDKIYMLEKG